ncbi:MAG: ferredoxin [Nanoarchaeota archaeon]|nr:ferredoxin [Nanoarchaeota archaeon]MBU1632501.1 ferredoxin [Nanoarchaeota archaeon]MBU1876705.1 ferredoxin [Nanoarchaeota archaeon]
MKFKIKHYREKCIGCGSCSSICPKNWVMKKDGKAAPIKTELDEIGCNQQAADSCPVKIIKITKIK